MSQAFGQLKILPKDWYKMTYAEHVLAYHGYQTDIYLQTSMHRRTAYEIYLSRPRESGKQPLSIHKFMPLPIDQHKKQSVEKIAAIHKLMIQRLQEEKDGQRRT